MTGGGAQRSTQGHSHDHSGHAHAPKDFGSAFLLGAGLNIAFVAVEATFGIIGNSTALLADAGHNLSDVLGLLVAWVAYSLTRRAPSDRYTYGLGSSSILAALFNAMLLLIAIGAICWEAFQRISHPEPVASLTMAAVAGVGIFINAFTAWLFASGREGDINIRGAFLHMVADALVSLGVVIAGIAIWMTGWLWLDPVVSLVIACVIFVSTWSLLRDSVVMSLAGVPAHVVPGDIRAYLEGLPGVTNVHDLHIWPISTSTTAMTCHLVMPNGHPGDSFLMSTALALSKRFHIDHPTLQIETDLGAGCTLAQSDVI